MPRWDTMNSTGLFILVLFWGIWRRSVSEKLSRDIVLILSIPWLIGAFGISEKFVDMGTVRIFWRYDF